MKTLKVKITSWVSQKSFKCSLNIVFGFSERVNMVKMRWKHNYWISSDVTNFYLSYFLFFTAMSNINVWQNQHLCSLVDSLQTTRWKHFLSFLRHFSKFTWDFDGNIACRALKCLQESYSITDYIKYRDWESVDGLLLY